MKALFTSLKTLVTASALAAVSVANGQTYPTKPIHVVVPWAPGGGADIVARMILPKLSERLGQPIVVENKPGAASNIGAAIVAKSPADGYTLLMATITAVTNPSLYTSLDYDPRGFDAVALLAGAPHILVVHPSVPAKTPLELVALAKSQPGKLTYATAGRGSPFHMAGELFQVVSGTKMLHVPYKGGAPALSDLVGGHVDVAFAVLLSALPHIKDGRLRALGVTTASRSAAVPDIPSVAEAGVKGYDFVSWHGMLAPKGTPKEVIQKLYTELSRIMTTAEMKENLSRQGAEPMLRSPQEFAGYLASETERWALVLKQAGIQPE